MRRLPDDFITIKQKALVGLRDIRKRAGNQDGKHPTYENILCMINKEEEDLFVYWFYHEWVKKRKAGNEEPLVLDRINNMGHYELRNLQLITQSENEKKKSGDHALQYVGRIPNADEKYCNSCKRILLRKRDFHKDSHEKDGLRGNCKECTNKINKKKK